MSDLKISIRDDFSDALRRKLAQAGPKAEHALADIIEKDTEQFVPASGAEAGMYNRAQVDGSRIIYPGPYARYLYYGKVMVYKDPPYLRTVNGKEILSHYGQRKVATKKPLKIKKHHHEHAQSHWLNGSKAKNMEKWEREAGKLVEKYLDE